MQYTVNTPMHPSAGVIQVSPDRGKKRTLQFTVITGGRTIYIAKSPYTLKNSFGASQAGIQIKDTSVIPTIPDWEGPCWVCASADGTLIDFEEPDLT